MATHIHLRSTPHKVWKVGEDNDREIVFACIRDYQIALGLVPSAKKDREGTMQVNTFVPETDLTNVYLEDLAASFEVGIKCHDYDNKWKVVSSNLTKTLYNHASTWEPLPADSFGHHHIENPLFSKRFLDLGEWVFNQDGVYAKNGGDSYSIPKHYMVLFTKNRLVELYEEYVSSSSDEEESDDALTLLSKLKSSMLELDSRNSVKRTEEINRKLNSLALLIRNMMAEMEDND